MVYDSNMVCPDCGQLLEETPVTNIDKSFRCKNCGGFWIENWVVNRVAEGQMRELPEVKTEVAKFVGKTNQCPVDSSPLFGDNSSQIPPEVTAEKCSHCGWWWFPADNIFKFKKAYEAKTNYLKWWKGHREVTMLAIPAILVLVMAVGLSLGVYNLTHTQGTGVIAASVTEFRAEYLGGGVEVVRFKTGETISFVSFRKLADEVWGPTELSKTNDGWYETRLQGLDEDQIYQMQIAGKRFYFKTK